MLFRFFSLFFSDSSTLLTGFGLGKGGNVRERRIGVPFAPDRSKATKKTRLRTKDDSVLSRSTGEGAKEGMYKVLFSLFNNNNIIF